jgi:hypothetical protein
MGRVVAILSPLSPESDPRKIVVCFVADEVTLVQIFLRLFRFYPVTLIPPVFHNHISIIFLQRDIIISVDGVFKHHTSLFNITPPLSIIAQKLTKSFVVLVSRVQKWNNRVQCSVEVLKGKTSSIEGLYMCPTTAYCLIFH